MTIVVSASCKRFVSFATVWKTIDSRKMHLLIQKKVFVNGKWVAAASGKEFDVLNPANGSRIGVVPDMDAEDAKRAVETASRAFKSWQNTTAKERSTILRKWYDLLVANAESLAKIMTAESGKPMSEARGEVNYGNSFVEWFSEQARHINGEIIASPVKTKKIFVEKQPIGVVGLITPWNFPHAMITRKAGAALAAGCTCVIKPSEDTPFTALALAQLAEEAGMPEGVFNVITCSRGNTAAIGSVFCENPLVAGISFTGSTEVGKLLYKQCASGVKRVGLELGGNAPFIVFESADIGKAVDGAIASKFRNCGQTCVASNRFFVQDKVFDAFVNKFKEQVKQLKMGDGSQADVTIGPLINEPLIKKVKALVDDAVCKGAKIEVGGKPATQHGKLFYEPTIITNIKENMRVYDEEVFGPVATILSFKTEEEALKIANATQRGLAGYFYSQDVSQIFRVSRLLEVGMVGVNEGIISTTEAPFGGIKESGLGREGSHYGIEEYIYIKYICVGNL